MISAKKFAVARALLFVLVSWACSGGEGSFVEIEITSPPTAAPAPTPTRVPAGPIEGVFLDLLARIPALETQQFVLTLNDLTKMQEQTGIVPADYVGGTDALNNYIVSIEKARDSPLLLLRPFPAFAGIEGLFDPSIGLEGPKYFGFDFRDVNSLAVLEIESDSFDSKFQIVRGNISSTLAYELISSCGECAQPELRAYDGIEYWSWPRTPGKPNGESDVPSLFKAQRRPTRLIIDDGVAVQALDDAGIEALMDLALGTGKSMADDENLVGLVTAMDEFEASNVVITAPGVTVDALLEGHGVPDRREMEEFATMAPLLKPYLAAAAGAGRDGEGRFNVVAFAH